jgi:hypothetical protein
MSNLHSLSLPVAEEEEPDPNDVLFCTNCGDTGEWQFNQTCYHYDTITLQGRTLLQRDDHAASGWDDCNLETDNEHNWHCSGCGQDAAQETYEYLENLFREQLQ